MKMEGATTIYLMTFSRRNLKNSLMKKIDGEAPYKWAYFGENVLNAFETQQEIGDRGIQLDIGALLQKVAREGRKDYIDYVGGLDVERNSTFWWASSFSEKNPLVSKTFQYSCYIQIALDFVKLSKGTFLFIVENDALRKALYKNIREK